MNANTNLNVARNDKNDEFYTRLVDIEDEMAHYREHFEGKTVYCNCDDPTVSKFFFYFARNFKTLGLKSLITTCYRNSQPTLFSSHDCDQGAGIRLRGGVDWDGNPESPDLTKHMFGLKGDGGFDTPECIEMLKEADIVVTNPPFSLFRKYFLQLIEHEKNFIILGNALGVSAKAIFPFFLRNEVWFGVTNRGRKFDVPGHYHGIRSNIKEDKDGSLCAQFGNVWWYTNLPHGRRNEELKLIKKYSKKRYPMLDNYSAIHVGNTDNIPKDYPGVMAVSTMFLGKHNPDQFEILAITNRDIDHPYKTKIYKKEDFPKKYGDMNARSVLVLPDGSYKCHFPQVLIRNLKPE